jgi:dipeptidase E
VCLDRPVENLTSHCGSGYLDHAAAEICNFLGQVKRVLFVPYALYDRDTYTEQARTRFQKMGYDLTSVHQAADAIRAVDETEAIFIGGGNTFRLLKALYDAELLEPIRRRAADGMPYVGSSAGSSGAMIISRFDIGRRCDGVIWFSAFDRPTSGAEDGRKRRVQ